jgi:tRNA pseudouridine38-40 synthase
MLRFTFVGNGFLHKMVRILMGTILEIGLGKLPVTVIDDVLENKVREAAGETAPAQGLFLDEVFY